jgi:hypothetical protein
MERGKGPQIGFSEMWLDEGRSDRRTSGGNVVPCLADIWGPISSVSVLAIFGTFECLTELPLVPRSLHITATGEWTSTFHQRYCYMRSDS